MAPHSSTLAWKIPWMEEPGRELLRCLCEIRDTVELVGASRDSTGCGAMECYSKT